MFQFTFMLQVLFLLGKSDGRPLKWTEAAASSPDVETKAKVPVSIT